ncbi:hypothetical protein SO694_00194039 [Aureococcus anophagefferens]|uniref:Uncharacterized protein n=1 Tax=Aureococcus anophagefferens TaxID=44056 RepID=A0ABR1FNV5_AURAN
MTNETEWNGNVFSSKCLPITLAARGVKVDLWDAFIGDLLGLSSLGLGRLECCVVATVGCPVFCCSQLERSSSSLCAGRARLWRERANAVCLRHAPAFGVLGISLQATVATDDISRGDGPSDIGEPWQGTCVEFSWTPPATALVLREGGDGSLKPKPDSKTAYWEALPLGPADTPCVHVPVPPGMAPGARLQVLAPQGGAFVVQVPNPPPATILVQVPPGLSTAAMDPDPSSPKATSIPVPTLNQLAAGNQLAAPTSPQMQRDAAVAGQVVGVAAMAPGAPPMNPVVAGAAAGPVAQVVGGGALPSGQVVGAAQPYTEQYVAAVRRNSMRQEIPVATVQRVSMTGADADWKGFGKDGANAKSSGAADALHAAEAVALIGAAAAAAGIAISKSMK